MPKMLSLIVVDGAEFTWTRKPDRVVGVADESSLPEHLTSRIWRDADDMGFMVKGKHRVLLFVHVQDLKDPEGELVARVFQCQDIKHVEVHVLND